MLIKNKVSRADSKLLKETLVNLDEMTDNATITHKVSILILNHFERNFNLKL